MVIACSVGFVIGAVVSIPLGALGAIMIDRTLRDGLWGGLSIGLMSAVATAVCCGLSLHGIALLQPVPIVRAIVQGLGLVLLIVVGAQFASSPWRAAAVPPTRAAHRAGSNDSHVTQAQNLVLVLAFTFLNPTSYAFWANLAGVLHWTILRPGDLAQNLAFSGGVAIGSAASQYIALVTVQMAAERFPSTRTVLRRIGSLVFGATIACFGYSLVLEIADLMH